MTTTPPPGGIRNNREPAPSLFTTMLAEWIIPVTGPFPSAGLDRALQHRGENPVIKIAITLKRPQWDQILQLLDAADEAARAGQ
jgi:hypothetical protein